MTIADVRDAVAALLERNGYVVMPASNGQEALDELHGCDERPSLILLDLMMPVMDGRAFYEEQQADPDLRDIPVVAFTSFPGRARRHERRQDGAPGQADARRSAPRLGASLVRSRPSRTRPYAD